MRYADPPRNSMPKFRPRAKMPTRASTMRTPEIAYQVFCRPMKSIDRFPVYRSLPMAAKLGMSGLPLLGRRARGHRHGRGGLGRGFGSGGGTRPGELAPADVAGLGPQPFGVEAGPLVATAEELGMRDDRHDGVGEQEDDGEVDEGRHAEGEGEPADVAGGEEVEHRRRQEVDRVGGEDGPPRTAPPGLDRGGERA